MSIFYFLCNLLSKKKKLLYILIEISSLFFFCTYVSDFIKNMIKNWFSQISFWKIDIFVGEIEKFWKIGIFFSWKNSNKFEKSKFTLLSLSIIWKNYHRFYFHKKLLTLNKNSIFWLIIHSLTFFFDFKGSIVFFN